MQVTKNPNQTTINLFFGKRNQSTLQKFDSLSMNLRRSRTATLDFLIGYYEYYDENKGNSTHEYQIRQS